MKNNTNFSILARLYKNMEGKYLIFYILGIIGSSSMQFISYFIIALSIRAVTNAGIKNNMYLFYKSMLWMIILLFAYILFSTISMYAKSYAVKKTMAITRYELFEHILKLPMNNFNSTHSGDFYSKITQDFNVASAAIETDLTYLFMALISGIGSAIFIFSIDWKIGVLVVILSFFTFLINKLFLEPIRKINQSIQEAISNATQKLIDLLDGIITIKLYTAEDVVYNKYVKENDKILSLSMKGTLKKVKLDAVNYFIGIIQIVGIISLSTILNLYNNISAGNIIAINQMSFGITFLFVEFGNILVGLQKSLAGAERMFKLMDECAEMNLGKYEISENIKNCESLIEFRNVSFSYNDYHSVINDLTLRILPNEKIGIIGKNGAGKSTILKLLLNFYQLKSGDIFLNGRSIYSYSLKNLRQQIAYVPQDVYLFCGTIEENIKIANPQANIDSIIDAAKLANAHDFIMSLSLGYNTKVGSGGVTLSGGEKQRIAIARAVLKNAPIVLLDEPTSALDYETEKLVQNALKNLFKDKTVIIITHKLSILENSIDKIYGFSNDGIRCFSTYEEAKKAINY